MRLGVLVVGVLCARVAHADPVEVSGFVGVSRLGDRVQLGNAFAADQAPGTSALVGARAGWVAFSRTHVALAFEGELALAPAFTGSSEVGGRMSYFAPVLGYRAQAVVRVPLGRVTPHVLWGAGGESVTSSSPFVGNDTDGIIYLGVGAAMPVHGWTMRLDLRQGFMPARDSGLATTYEVQLGVGVAFGGRHAPRVVIQQPPVMVDDRDRDGDGIPDRLDQCPDEKETINGIADDDGCPESDPDGDGIVGDKDKCPTEAEDFDGFQDEDGCPEPDNDGDGVPDKVDACPLQAETVNGVDDEDGCPDTVPPEITSALAAASGLKFEVGRARLTSAAVTALAALQTELEKHPGMKLKIVGHPDKKTDDKASDLAKRRAEAVKWQLVDHGVAEDRIEVEIGEVDKRHAIDVTLSL